MCQINKELFKFYTYEYVDKNNQVDKLCSQFRTILMLEKLATLHFHAATESALRATHTPEQQTCVNRLS